MPALKAIFSGDATPLDREMVKVELMAAKMAGAVKGSVGGMFGRLGGLLTFAGVEESARRAIELGHSIELAAKEAGVGVEFFQGLESAAHKMGISIETAGNSLSILSRKIGEARMGGKEQSLFSKWKIDIDNLNNEQIFYKIADKLASLHDPALRNAMAFDLMGKGAKEMAVGMEMGADGLRQLISEADKLSAQQIQNLNAVDVKLEELARKWKMLWGTIVTFGMTAAAPIGREIEVQIMTANLASAKGLNIADIVKKQKTGSWEQKGAAMAQFDMLRQEAIETVVALHAADKPGKSAAPTKDAEADRRADVAHAKHIISLKEHLFDLQRNNDLMSLSKEEQIQELYRRRAELIKAMGATKGEEGKLNAAIDVEKIDAELRGLTKEGKPINDSASGRMVHGSLTSMQAQGAYASPAASVMIDTAKKQVRLLESINAKMDRPGGHSAASLSGVKY